MDCIFDPCTSAPHSVPHACMENVDHAVLRGGGPNPLRGPDPEQTQERETMLHKGCDENLVTPGPATWLEVKMTRLREFFTVYPLTHREILAQLSC